MLSVAKHQLLAVRLVRVLYVAEEGEAYSGWLAYCQLTSSVCDKLLHLSTEIVVVVIATQGTASPIPL